jgi:hypothetical protein
LHRALTLDAVRELCTVSHRVRVLCALRVYTHTRSHAQKRALTWHLLGDAYARRGKHVAAVKAMRRALELDELQTCKAGRGRVGTVCAHAH